MNILHSDPEILVIEKPGGLLSVPGRGTDKQDCVVSRIRKLYPDIIEQPAPHRLDMYTSGLMILAKTCQAHRDLARQFEKRAVEKTYIALLEGKIKGDEGEIALPFRLDIDNRPYQIYDPIDGKMGITRWKMLSFENPYSKVEFKPLTGRTHQLRLHAAHKLGLGIPIVGDSLYGNGRDGDQMMLHASSISFTHPGTGRLVSFHSIPPF